MMTAMNKGKGDAYLQVNGDDSLELEDQDLVLVAT